MVIGGLILTILTAILLVSIVICNKWTRKVTNCYFFWLAIAALSLGWLLANRFVPDWIKYITNKEHDDITISRAFLLDACPFSALAMCVSLIVDPSRKMARLFSPLAIIGGSITIVSLSFDQTIGAEMSAEFIFYGFYPNKCYYALYSIGISCRYFAKYA